MSYKEDIRMGHTQREWWPKSKMTSSDDRFTFEIVHVLHFGNGLNVLTLTRGTLLQIYLYKSSRITLGRVWLEILVANLATNFQDLVAKVKNLVALVPVLGAILRPAGSHLSLEKNVCA